MSEKKIEVFVIYNGVKKTFDVEPEAAAQSLLSRAIAAFGTHQLVLGFPDGRDVDLSGSIQAAGITNGAELILKPHAVRGGHA